MGPSTQNMSNSFSLSPNALAYYQHADHTFVLTSCLHIQKALTSYDKLIKNILNWVVYSSDRNVKKKVINFITYAA